MPKCHRQLILNAVVRNQNPSPQACQAWLDSLVPKIDMKTLVPASVVYCDDPGNEGVTGVVVITTSHAAFHFWDVNSDQPNRLSFCLYSCSWFDVQVVLDHIDQFWGLESYEHKLLDRAWEIREIEPALEEMAASAV